MKKLVLLAIIAAALVLTGCPSPAGGNPNNNTPAQIDYLERLIGTWQTEGYDSGKFITVTIEADPSGKSPAYSFEFKAKHVFSGKNWTTEMVCRNSTYQQAVKDGTKTTTEEILAVTDTYIQTQKGKVDYGIKEEKLYFTQAPNLLFERK